MKSVSVLGQSLCFFLFAFASADEDRWDLFLLRWLELSHRRSISTAQRRRRSYTMGRICLCVTCFGSFFPSGRH